MNINETIKNRHSVRKFKPDVIKNEIVVEMLEAARLAPSPGNGQNYFFGVITDKNVKDELAVAAGKQMWIADAPLIFACCTDLSWNLEDAAADDFGRIVNNYRFGESFVSSFKNNPYAKSLNILLHNSDPLLPMAHLLLTATSHGLGGCIVGFLDVMCASKVLKLPENMCCLYLLPIGFPADKTILNEKKSIHEISFYNLYSDN